MSKERTVYCTDRGVEAPAVADVDPKAAISVVFRASELIRPITSERRNSLASEERALRSPSQQPETPPVMVPGETAAQNIATADVAVSAPTQQSAAKNSAAARACESRRDRPRRHGRACLQIRRRRHRAILAQSGAARGTKRPRARRLSAAARARPHPRRACRRDRRDRQNARPSRRILAVRSATRRRIAEPARQGLSRTLGRVRQAARRRARRGRHCAGARRQALQRSGMDVEPVLRLSQAALSPHLAMGRPAGGRCRRCRRAHAAEGRVLRPPDRQRDRADAISC